MKIDIKYIDNKFKALLSGADYKDVSKIVDYVVIQKYNTNERTSSNTPSGYHNKKEFPIGKRCVGKSFSKGIQESYINEVTQYLNSLIPIKQGERIWVDLISRFLNRNDEELYEKELHGGVLIDASNFETELANFTNMLNDLVAKTASNEELGTPKRFNRNINAN